MKISELEAALFGRFPANTAEPWDHVGLSVGEPEAEVAGVAVALDATEANVRRAAESGANVLLTHHPVYIKAPDAFTPASPARPAAAAAVYTAARTGVSVLSYHTNLDRSHEARALLPSMLGLEAASSLEFPDEPERCGLGALCELGEPRTLGEVARACADAFGCAPRVWGDAESPLATVAFLGGSLGGLGDLALAAGTQAVVCGEAGYHVCQDLALRGCGVVLLGHDRSEEPFAAILMDAAVRAGIDPSRVHRIKPRNQWWTQPIEQERP